MTNSKKLLKYMENNEKCMLLLLVFFTLILRLIFTIVLFLKTGATETQYLYWGEQFAQGNWVEPKGLTSGMIVAPYISLLLTLFIKLFSEPILPFYIYNVILTTLVVPVLYLIGKELFNKQVGWLILTWGIFFPEFFKYSPTILKESTLFFLIPFTILMLIKSIKEPEKAKYIFYSSLSFAVLIHTDERFVFYLPVFACGFFLIKPFQLGKVLKSFSIWFVIIFILSIPWNIRNYLVYDQLVIISPRTTAFTSNFWGDNLTKLEFYDYDRTLNRNKEKFSTRSQKFEQLYSISPKEYRKGEVKLRAFINFWQPAYFKPAYITYGFRPQKWSWPHNLASIFFYGIFIPFYIISFFLLVKEKYWLGIFLSMIPIIHSLLHSFLVSPLERYRSTITFIIVLMALWTIRKTFFWIKSKSLNSPSIPA